MTANELLTLDDLLKRVEEIRSRILEFVETFGFSEEENETVLRQVSKVASSESDESPKQEVTQ